MNTKSSMKSTDELKEILKNRELLTKKQADELLPDVFDLCFNKGEYSFDQMITLCEMFEHRIKAAKKQIYKKGHTCVVKFESDEQYYNHENEGFEVGEITAVNSKRAGVKFLNEDIPELNVPYHMLACHVSFE